SVPSAKEKGSKAYAGTINGEGYLEMRVSAPSDRTLVSKIAEIVQNAERQKSGAEKFVDRFAAIYTPAVILLSVLVAIVPALVFSQPFDTWFYRALVLLVTACPCALAISTPVSLVSGISSAAKNGILVRGGDYLEKAAGAKAVIFDKTGTLTEGVFEVADVAPLNGYSKEELLRIAASLEAKSEHPIARAIMHKAPKGLHMVSKFMSYPGKGISGMMGGVVYFAGNLKLPVNSDEKSTELMRRLESEGKTVVIIATQKQAIGIISISDRLRDGAREAVSELEAMGITSIMLTGDNKDTAQAIASRVGIKYFHAGLLPEQKLEEVKRLRQKYGAVMMVGDGVNDAPALAVADVGIAMGAIGSDVAIETADAAIMRDDLSKIPFLVRLGRKTMNVVKENVAASLIVKGGVGLMAFFGLISLWVAVAVGDMGLSLLVIGNALRIGMTGMRTAF
ncbi:MAG: cation-translocating P-type ATPase, partial [Nitrospiraceae bacterium]|nr:cation-translocating P-type ATPase [Nitrospiraceae bacterium]